MTDRSHQVNFRLTNDQFEVLRASADLNLLRSPAAQAYQVIERYIMRQSKRTDVQNLIRDQRQRRSPRRGVVTPISRGRQARRH